MTPVAISADGKSHGKLCSLAIDLNASKQIAPQATASAGTPCRRISPIASPFWLFDRDFVSEHHGPHTPECRLLSSTVNRRNIAVWPKAERRKPLMLTREENELVTRVGPGTPMGDVLRRYWIPALMSRELPEADCPPVRVKLLGEKLVAFRDSQGRIGLVDEFCPHRRASLWFGRNEESGLRCIYHGWKFDVEGKCLEQMNEPEPFCHKVRLTAYPTTEIGGGVWAYMGPRDKMPAPPAFEWTQVPETHRHVSKVWEECNWLQALEGGIDN